MPSGRCFEDTEGAELVAGTRRALLPWLQQDLEEVWERADQMPKLLLCTPGSRPPSRRALRRDTGEARLQSARMELMRICVVSSLQAAAPGIRQREKLQSRALATRGAGVYSPAMPSPVHQRPRQLRVAPGPSPRPSPSCSGRSGFGRPGPGRPPPQAPWLSHHSCCCPRH